MKSVFSSKLRQLFFIFTLLIATCCFGQIDFEKGYFIDNQGTRTDCLIKNEDWSGSPDRFRYKTAQDGPVRYATIDHVQEFAIGNTAKYKRATVDIDGSSDQAGTLSSDPNPIFTRETVFLTTLIEGEASLYRLGARNRYFYSINDRPVTQLIHKSFLNEDGKVRYNMYFRRQLHQDLKCEDINYLITKDIAYNTKDLTAYFQDFNECRNAEFTQYENSRKKGVLKFIAIAGVRYASLSVDQALGDTRDVDFGGKMNPTFGLQAEYILPFNKDKWSVMIEPTYQSFRARIEDPIFPDEVDYRSVEIPLGIKYNMHLNTRSKLFLSGSLVLLDLRFDSYINDLGIRSANNAILGIGYTHNDRYQIAFRYSTPRPLLSGYGAWTTNYPSFTVALGYTLFKTGS